MTSLNFWKKITANYTYKISDCTATITITSRSKDLKNKIIDMKLALDEK